jgi:hypothetical protein
MTEGQLLRVHLCPLDCYNTFDTPVNHCIGYLMQVAF